MSFAFALVSLAYLVAILFSEQWLQFAAKPLLMPVLILQLYLAKKSTGEKNWKLVVLGLAGSWLGDVLLMAGDKQLFFILGLLFFLATHVAYIFYFLRYKPDSNENWFRHNPIVSLGVVSYAIIFLAAIISSLGTLLLPVAMYTVVITVMLLQALASQHRIKKSTYFLFVAGAAFFVASDSMLAFNKFFQSFNAASLAIMITYCLAQWLIVQGTIANTDEILNTDNVGSQP